ncbi:hypothetical protein PFISCL1PPCAC_13783, partial [Pristionchus fissidentatus]
MKMRQLKSTFQCEATVLNTKGTHCILLGSESSDVSTNSCPAPYTSWVKTTSGCIGETPNARVPNVQPRNLHCVHTFIGQSENCETTVSSFHALSRPVDLAEGSIDGAFTHGECTIDADVVGTPTYG